MDKTAEKTKVYAEQQAPKESYWYIFIKNITCS